MQFEYIQVNDTNQSCTVQFYDPLLSCIGKRAYSETCLPQQFASAIPGSQAMNF